MAFLKKIDFLLIGFTRPICTFFVIYLLYLLLGSLCFTTLESRYEMKTRNETMQSIIKIQGMVKKLRNANYSEEDIRSVFVTQQDKRKKAIETRNLSWSYVFFEKSFFAFILITTIGYGNVTPKTMLGQCICVIFTMFGLPLHVIMMRLLSVKYRGGLNMILKMGLRSFPGSRIVLIALGVSYFLFWAAILLFIPAWILMITETWEYYQSFYFSFVSLTTIGLGDYVTGVSDTSSPGAMHALTVILTVIWFFFGLGFIAMAVNLMSYLMGLYTLDKLDCKCRERTAAMQKLNVLLEMMKELNWQLVKGKPDDFENWSEIEDFRNLLEENPQNVTPTMLHRMFDIIIELKEKSYNQISEMQTLKVPITPALQRAKDALPTILSTDSVILKKIESDPKKRKNGLDPSQSLQNSPQTPEQQIDRDITSDSSLRYSGAFQEQSARERPETSNGMNAEDTIQRDVIEDKRGNFKEDTEAADADEIQPNPQSSETSIDMNAKDGIQSDNTEEKRNNFKDGTEAVDADENRMSSKELEKKSSHENGSKD